MISSQTSRAAPRPPPLAVTQWACCLAIGWPSCTVIARPTRTITGGAVDVPASSFLKEVDVAAVFGVGLTFPVGRYELTGELRYRQGLVNMARESLGSRLDTLPPRFRFAGFQLQVGLMLPWGGRR